LPEGYSGGLQHRAVLQQDCYSVDLRCMSIRPELIPLYEEVTGMTYKDNFSEALAENEQVEKKSVIGALDDRFIELNNEEIVKLSIKLCEEIRKRGYRVMWDPCSVKRV
ncbi:MAG: hypothetical protein J5959_17905, partial [Butyrivibrio sp.]|nr:hypothetical protein [Butyrivibrio sp.]